MCVDSLITAHRMQHVLGSQVVCISLRCDGSGSRQHTSANKSITSSTIGSTRANSWWSITLTVISSTATHQWPEFKQGLKPFLYGVLQCLRYFDHPDATEPARLIVIVFSTIFCTGILAGLFKAPPIDIPVARSTLVNRAPLFGSV